MEYTICTKDDNEFFNDVSFSDVGEFHDYYNREKRSEERIAKYDCISLVMDFYSELRNDAEENAFRGKNQHGALPVFYKDVYQKAQSFDHMEEPPLRLIVLIAINDFANVKKLLESIRHVLTRKRALTQIERSQQIDSQCIIWLTRQPGRTTEEKAGPKQKILSVIREETADTLENRVLKQFLKLCVIECDSYIHAFSDRFSNSKRIKEVRRLRTLAKSALESPEFSLISNLHGIQQPNYVLQNNRLYNIVWHYYLQLVHRTRLAETIWSRRHIFLRELATVILLSVYDHNDSSRKIVGHEFWIRQFPTENETYIEGPFFYLDFSNLPQRQRKVLVANDFIKLSETSNEKGIYNSTIEFVYLPAGAQFPIQGYRKIVAFVEEDVETDVRYKIPLDVNVVTSCFDVMKAVCK